MDLVLVRLSAVGYYSEAEYEDNIWIKKSSYEKLKDTFPSEVCCGELDGKHSEVMGDIDIEDLDFTEADYVKLAAVECDGDTLEWSLKDLYDENDLDFKQEQKEIEEYFNTLDVWEDVTIKIPRSLKTSVLEYVEKLRNQDNTDKKM